MMQMEQKKPKRKEKNRSKLEKRIKWASRTVSIGAWGILFSIVYLLVFLPAIFIFAFFFSVEASIFLAFVFYFFLSAVLVVLSGTISIKSKRKSNKLKLEVKIVQPVYKTKINEEVKSPLKSVQ